MNTHLLTTKNTESTEKAAGAASGALRSLRSLRLTLPACRLVVVGLLALAAGAARANEEQELIALLKSPTNAPAKCDACLKLRLVGTAKAVPALAALLGDERTSQAARYALEGMPVSKATTALRKALGRTAGAVQAGLIDSAGWRHDAAAVPLLKKALLGNDVTNATAAAVALGRIGGKKALAALTAAQAKVPATVQPAVQEGELRCAEQLLAGGNTNGAAALYRRLVDSQGVERLRVAAWRGLVLADAKDRGVLLAQALTNPAPPLHAAALQVVRELKEAGPVDVYLRHWRKLPADAQLAVLEARLKLGGRLFGLLSTAAQGPYPAVRMAACQALGDMGDATAIPLLTHAATHGQPAEREAAREALARLRGPGVDHALYQEWSKGELQEKVALTRAMGERLDTNAVSLLEASALTQPEAVRLAALEALRKIAAPSSAAPLLTLAAKAKSDAECEAVLSALYAVCQASPNKHQTAGAVLEAMKPLPDDQVRRVLPVLAELATPEALAAAQAAAQAKQDPETAKAAVRVLAQWPNAAPATTLLALAHTSTDSVLQVLALRGAITVAGQEPDNAKRLALLQQAMAAAQRPDEKKQALGQLGQVPTPEALQAAMGYLANADLANEAGLAALSIAEKLAPSQPELAQATATKVLAQCNTPDIVKRAWAIRGKKAAASGPFIQDWLVCGPYTKPGVTGAEALFDVAFAPEQSGATVQWKALPRGKTAELSAFFSEQVNCVAYLKAQIVAPQDCDATLLLGSDDGVKAWLNGAVVHSHNVDRGLVADQDMAPIKLKQGANELLLKITQGGGGWGACARVVGNNGQPIKGLKYQVER